MTLPLTRFIDLRRTDWRVERITSSWLLVFDGASRWFCRSEDITTDILNSYEADYSALRCLPPEATDKDVEEAVERKTNAYTELCQHITAYEDRRVPRQVLSAARRLLYLDINDPVCNGF